MKVLKSMTIACALLLFASASSAVDFTSGSGTVVETMDSAGYTYVLLEESGRWVAGSPIKVAVGEKVKYSGAVEMGEFHSRSLNRTFESILFAQKLEYADLVRMEDHSSSELVAAMGSEVGITKNTAATPEIGEITPLEGGMTIDAIRTGFEELNGQQVAVRARVMKVSMNVLGKNWITLKDGTGIAPRDKLLATSAGLVEIGDLVTASGVVNTNVDLGSGYKYEVVLEGTTFSK